MQWGMTVLAVIIIWFKPPIGEHCNFYYHLSGAEPFITLLGLGCRSASYITYGVLSTLVWMMHPTSSILTYYSTNIPTCSFQENFILALQVRVAHWLSIFLCHLGKLISGLNSVWIVAIGLLQFSSFYDQCYCNSGVMGLGKHAYNVISPVDVGSMRTTWIGGFFLAARAVMIFTGFVTLFIDPPLP